VIEASCSEVILDHVFKGCPVGSVCPADLVPSVSESIGRRTVAGASSAGRANRRSIPKNTK
jgi:hypothetical protein